MHIPPLVVVQIFILNVVEFQPVLTQLLSQSNSFILEPRLATKTYLIVMSKVLMQPEWSIVSPKDQVKVPLKIDSTLLSEIANGWIYNYLFQDHLPPLIAYITVESTTNSPMMGMLNTYLPKDS